MTRAHAIDALSYIVPAFRPPDDTTPAPPNVIAACRAKLRGKDQP